MTAEVPVVELPLAGSVASIEELVGATARVWGIDLAAGPVSRAG